MIGEAQSQFSIPLIIIAPHGKFRYLAVVVELGSGVDPFMMHIYAALAEKERAMISRRTKDALAAAKARGTILGNPRITDARAKGCCQHQGQRRAVRRQRPTVHTANEGRGREPTEDRGRPPQSARYRDGARR